MKEVQPCSCDGPGHCPRYKREMGAHKFSICSDQVLTPRKCMLYRMIWDQRAGNLTDEEVKEIEESLPPEQKPVHVNHPDRPKVSTPALVSSIGDRMRGIIEREIGSSIPCGACKKHIASLNQMTVRVARQNKAAIVEQIADRAQSTAPKFWQRLAIKVDRTLNAGETERRIEACLNEAIDAEEKEQTEKSEEEQEEPSILKWAYGITTVPSRVDDLFPRTLESLKLAGFGSPWVFVDGAEDPSAYKQFGLNVTVRNPNIRTHGNWVLSMYELYIRTPDADRYIIFQDDFITYRNLKQYLEKCSYPPSGYCNLYTFPANQRLCPKDYHGWYRANQRGLGAVALMFDLEAVTKIIGSDYMVQRPKSASRGWKAVDGGIVTAMKNIGYREYVHNPSLVQHTGRVSTMKNKRHAEAMSFRGENFNALELTPQLQE